jgi:hypothetical protein
MQGPISVTGRGGWTVTLSYSLSLLVSLCHWIVLFSLCSHPLGGTRWLEIDIVGYSIFLLPDRLEKTLVG